MVEAALILPTFFLFVFALTLICVQLFSLYSTYYACFQSIKSSSTGPRKVDGIMRSVEYILKQEVATNLVKFKTGANINNVIVRNQFGCYYLYNSQPAALQGCTNTQPSLRITPNSWVTLNVPVTPVNIKIYKFKLPSVNVKSTIRMYDWIS